MKRYMTTTYPVACNRGSNRRNSLTVPLPMTSLLVIHSNFGPVSNRLPDKGRFRPKIAKFSHLRVF